MSSREKESDELLYTVRSLVMVREPVASARGLTLSRDTLFRRAFVNTVVVECFSRTCLSLVDCSAGRRYRSEHFVAPLIISSLAIVRRWSRVELHASKTPDNRCSAIFRVVGPPENREWSAVNRSQYDEAVLSRWKWQALFAHLAAACKRFVVNADFARQRREARVLHSHLPEPRERENAEQPTERRGMKRTERFWRGKYKTIETGTWRIPWTSQWGEIRSLQASW